jgi:hypothetical protein
MNPAAQATHMRASMRWQREHPEAYRRINARAQKRYHDKLRRLGVTRLKDLESQ